MAHFRAIIQGNRGQASRLGSKASGIEAYVASWQGAVAVRLSHDAETGKDTVSVMLTPHQGVGTVQTLYHGPIGGKDSA